MTDSEFKRFAAKLELAGTGCWLWTGAIKADVPVGAGGYGVFGVRERELRKDIAARAHRIAYLHFRGSIPPGLVLDHLCRVRRCVNPWHLEPVTVAENLARSPIALVGFNHRKSHCKRGHPLSGDNLLKKKRGWRECKACHDLFR